MKKFTVTRFIFNSVWLILLLLFVFSDSIFGEIYISKKDNIPIDTFLLVIWVMWMVFFDKE